MNRRNVRISLVLLAAAGALMSVAIACGGDNEDNGASETPQGTVAGATVYLEATEYAITGLDGGAITSPSAGAVTLEVHNEGTIDHEVVIIKTDLDEAALPTSGTTVDENAAGDVVGEVEEFDAGTVESVTVNVEAGHYVLICNIAGHYEQGMYATLVVQ